MRAAQIPSIVVALLLGACGGDDDDGSTGGADAGAGECDEEPCLELPEEGFQVRNEGTMIQSGDDIEYCEVVQLPGTPSDTYYVNRFEAAMTRGSHHLLVAAAEVGSETEANAQVGDRVECFAGTGFGDNIIEVTGSQLPYDDERFPAGVGRVYTGGQKLIFNYHYLNLSDDPIEARAAVNFHTTDEASIEKIAESAGFIFLGIDVDPGDQASYTMSCAFDTDVMVYKLSRHTHQWGTDFPVSFMGGERDGELIYTSPNYEDPDHFFEEPVLVKSGEGFRFTCNYDNTSTHHLGFGENATDEMCILFPTVYSPTAREVPGEQGCFAVNPE